MSALQKVIKAKKLIVPCRPNMLEAAKQKKLAE